MSKPIFNENGYRKCIRCLQHKNEEGFPLVSRAKKDGTYSRSNVCFICKRQAHEMTTNKHFYDGSTHKKCSQCQEVKELNGFYKGRTECKSCHWEYKRQNVEKIKLQKQQYYLDNKEYILERCKKYTEDNYEEVRDRKKRYADNNKEKSKEWRDKNKDKLNEYKRNDHKKRTASDIQYKLTKRLRSSLHLALNGFSKNQSTLEMLGCPIDEFKKYIELQFQDGMDWGNYGKIWVLDHIVPIAFFNLEVEKELNICFHYTNLRPFFADDNNKKSDYISSIIRGQYINHLDLYEKAAFINDELEQEIKNKELLDIVQFLHLIG